MSQVEQCNFFKTKLLEHELLEQIDQTKKEMIKVGLNKGFQHRETITVSTELDQLIYNYQIRNFIK